MTSVQTLSIPDQGQLAYTVSGPSSGPIVLLAHGIADSRHAYRFIEPQLTQAGYCVINMDLRGCSDSSADGWTGYSRTDVAHDMIALIKHVKQENNIGDERRVIIVGHSLAGGAGTIAAALEPSLIQGLIEIAPFTKAQSMGLGDLWRTGPLRLVGAVLFGSPKLWLSYLEAALPGSKRPSDWDTERERIRSKLAEPGRTNALSKMAFSPPTDAGEQLPNVKCPVLVIVGSADCDWASPQKEGEEILAMLPSGLGKLEIIDGAGHYPHFQYPQETLALMKPFLAKVAA